MPNGTDTIPDDVLDAVREDDIASLIGEFRERTELDRDDAD